MPILKTEAITRCFGTLKAVDQVSISVEAGEVFGLLGPNGAGKTTMLKMLTTLLPLTSGSATVAGFDVSRNAGDVRRCIGYVPQALSADDQLTGYENLLIIAKLYDIPRAGRDKRIKDALEYMGLADFTNKLVADYSGGMIRRLEIAQSMVHRPQVLFLDEPTTGLDPGARVAVWEHIEKMRTDMGTAILLTTHSMEEAESLCDRIAVMDAGTVVATGTPDELKASVGTEDATMDDVFIYYTGGKLDASASYRETWKRRRTARRLG